MGVTAVMGLQWGDEGKGKIVDALAQKADVVVRCQGGANAGHTIVVEGRQFILHLVPSGILREGVTCLVGNGVVVDLEVLDREIKEVGEAGISVSGRIVLSRRAHLVLPIHKQVEAMQEEVRGPERLDTTRRGIGPCYSDKYARLGIRVGDVLDRARLQARIRTLCAAYEHGRSGRPASDADENIEYCMRFGPMVRELAGDTADVIRRSIRQDKEILLEGSQGFLLDVDHGTYPFVTSSNTGIHGIACGAGLAPSDIGSVVGVVKTYMTRVGEGPLPTQMEEPYQTQVREKGKEYGATTGRPRRCGWLDLTAIKYSCTTNGVTSIALTKLDTLSGLDSLKLCSAYDYFGTCVEMFPPDTMFLDACRPRYVSVQPWGEFGDVSGFEDLPEAASDYVDLVMDAAGCRLEMVSVGPARDQLIMLGR